MGSSGGQTPVTQTQTKDPWSGAVPYLQQTMQGAADLYGGGTGYVPYPGQTYSDWTQPQTLGWNTAYSLAEANRSGTPGVTAARELSENMIRNQGLNTGLQTAAGQFGDIYSRALGDENPYLQGVINQQMNKVNSAMSGSGRYGSGMHDAAIAQAIAPTLAEDYNRRQQLQMQATGAMGDIYGQGLQRAGNFSQLMPALDEARFADANRLMQIGGMLQQQNQLGVDQALKYYNAQQARPWEQLARYNAIIQGTGGLGGSSVTTSPGAQQPSTMQRILGGALAGGGMGSMFGPAGMGIGALGGGLLGLM